MLRERSLTSGKLESRLWVTGWPASARLPCLFLGLLLDCPGKG